MGAEAAERERKRRMARGDTPSSCLAADAHLAAWGTPVTSDKGQGDGTNPKGRLGNQARLAARYTPTTEDRHHEMEAHHKSKPYGDLGTQARMADSGTTSNGSNAATGSSGRLNPDFVRYLMGFPEEWMRCMPSETRSYLNSRWNLYERWIGFTGLQANSKPVNTCYQKMFDRFTVYGA